MADPDETPLANDATVIAGFAGEVPAAAAADRLFAGRYQLLRELGRGGMGVVYRARDTMVGDEVALKTLDIGAAPSEAAIERFRREVRLARRITHPNVARTHDLGDFNGTHYLTMEFVEGEDLAGLLARAGRLRPARAAAIALQVCDGLAAAHAAGVVHRDLKPANIIVETGGRVVLTDFGIARALAAETAARTVGAIGTPVYMAPEQVLGAETDARTDVYAVGLLLYEALTGRLAFAGDSPIAAAVARLREPPPDPRAHAHVPDPLAELVLRCLEREPDDRPQGVAAIAEALRTWLSSQDEEGPAAAATTTPTTAPARLTAAALAALAPARGPAASTTGGRRTQALGTARVAVLPLRYAGPQDHAYLADGVTEALIDVLGRTRAVEVAASAASDRFRADRDPRGVGQGLGVAFVVDATLQAAGAAARATVRLLDAAAGVQLWSARFDGALADPFALQDLLSQQIAEALRTELQIALYREFASPQALDAFRNARREISLGFGPSFVDAYRITREHLDDHPGFTPGYPLLALLALRAWFSVMVSSDIDWEPRATASLADARRLAPDFPETAFASAMLAVQRGEWRAAAQSLRQTLAAAPYYAPAHQYLGSLRCEAGRADEGLPQIRAALDLDPLLPGGLFEYARCSALRGDHEGAEWALQRLRADVLRLGATTMLELRVAAWRGDRDRIRGLLPRLDDVHGSIGAAVRAYAAAALGEPNPAAFAVDAFFAPTVHPRVIAMLCQIAAEERCLAGAPEAALPYFQRAADTVLIDLEWCDRCPILAPLRAFPAFAEGRRKVRERVEGIWSA